MTFDPYADPRRLPDPKPPFPPSSAATTPSVKSESSTSPAPLHTFAFSYPLPSVRTPDNAPLAYDSRPHVFRFGMAHASSPHPLDSWSLKRPQHAASIALDMNALSFPDDYEDADELSDLPGTSGQISHAAQSERIIRRRSSKGTFRFPVRRLSL